jgi:hypothetical protein
MRTGSQRYIYEVLKEDLDKMDLRGQCSGAGWYFCDEAEQLNGPYETEKKAIEALNQYVKNL